ncbi:MAG: DNA-directed RNA polymerase subunit alpha [Candidatus Pacebacteria bacterium]|nr:DNA-directed RNA polymerase subunit alpha [Candidatus Paceibacterota bacterium]
MQKITLPEKPKIIKQEGNFAIFEIRSCYPGYGVTIGNAFRRVLLSSLSGSAITAINISGINHEFSTISGVTEDVVEIALNLKRVKFKMHTDETAKLTLKVSKEGEVKASEIKTTSDIEVVNKDAHIATINDKNSKLEMEIRVEKGIGYVPIEQQNKEKLEIGSIAMDAIFTPVKKVNFRVENMRVGKLTNYDKLILEIETSGEITPEEAFKKAARLLVDHFNLFREVIEEKIETEDEAEEKVKISKEKNAKKEKLVKEKKLESEENEKEKQEDILKTSTEDLNLSPRILNILSDGKIKGVSKLVKKSEEDLKELSGMGDKGIKEIKKSLGKLGLTLKI